MVSEAPHSPVSCHQSDGSRLEPARAGPELCLSGDAALLANIRLKSEVSHFNLEMILTQDHKSTFISYEYFCVVVLCDEKCTYVIKEKFIFKHTPESS